MTHEAQEGGGARHETGGARPEHGPEVSGARHAHGPETGEVRHEHGREAGGARRGQVARIREAVILSWRAGPVPLSVTVLCSLVSAALPVASALWTKAVVDTLARPGFAFADVLPPAAGLVVAGMLVAVVPRVGSYARGISDRAAGVLSQDLLFASVERFTGLRRFEDPAFQDRLRLAQQSTAQTPGQVVQGVLECAAGGLTVAGFLASVTTLGPAMLVLVAATAVPVLVAQLRLARHHASMLWKVSPLERREIFYTMLLSGLDAAKELRLFGTGPVLRLRMLAERRASNLQRRGAERRDLLTQGCLSLLAAVVSGVALIWAVNLAAEGAIGVGDVLLLVASVAGTQGAVTRIASAVAGTHRQLLLFDHYLGIIRAEPDLPVPVAGHRELPELRRGIEFRDVWFRYSDDHPWALHGVSVFIPYGQAVALVGRNGSGKSTLVKLLCRFYDPTRGSISWDGTDLRDVRPEDLRERMTVVFQDFMRYEMTAADNIGLGDVTAMGDRPVLESAARLAGVHDTLAALPRGYDTPLTRMFTGDGDGGSEEDGSSDDGVLLSGGQWQRLAIARALIRRGRDLVVLDEPSSGLDPSAEHDVHTRLGEHRAGRTSLLISHRLGAVRSADTILVLSGGTVIEQGTHDELVTGGGEYATLFRLQASGYTDDRQA